MLKFLIFKWTKHKKNLENLKKDFFCEIPQDKLDGRIQEIEEFIADLKFLQWHYKNRRRK